MAITFENSQTGNTGGGLGNGTSTTLTINRAGGGGAGAVGHFLIAVISFLGVSASITPPAGWTLVRSDTDGTAMTTAIFFKVMGASEPGSYTWTFSVAVSGSGGMSRYAGVSTASPVETSAAQANVVASASIVAPALVNRWPNEFALIINSTIPNTTITPEAGITDRYTSANPGGLLGAGAGPTIEQGDESLASAGTVDSETATAGATSTSIGQVVLLIPAGQINTIGQSDTGFGGARTANPSIGATVTHGSTSDEALGKPALTLSGLQATAPAGIPAEVAIGLLHMTLSGLQILAPAGVPPEEAIGRVQITLSGTQGVAPAGIPTSEAIGGPTVAQAAPQGVTGGLASGEGFGAAAVVLSGAQSLGPSGIPSEATLGASQGGLQAPEIITAAVPSGEGIGAPTVVLSGQQGLSPRGVDSGEVLGRPTVALTGLDFLAPAGIASAEGEGAELLALTGAQTVAPRGAATSEGFGAAAMTEPAALTVAPAGSSSAEAIASPAISEPPAFPIAAAGIPSAEALEVVSVFRPAALPLDPSGVSSTEAPGTLAITESPAFPIAPSGVVSQEAISQFFVVPEPCSAFHAAGPLVIDGTAGDTALTIQRPAGRQIGDLLIAVVSFELSDAPKTTVTPPAGWTLLRTDATAGQIQTSIFFAVNRAGDPSSDTFTYSPALSTGVAGIIAAYSFGPIDGSSGAVINNSTTAPATAPSLTTHRNQELVVGIWIGLGGPPFWTPPPDMHQDFIDPQSVVMFCSRGQSVAGPTGPETAQAVPSQPEFNTAQLLAITCGIAVVGIPSEEASGNPSFAEVGELLACRGIDSAEAIGNTQVTKIAIVFGPRGIETAEAFGAPAFTLPVLGILPAGVATSEAIASTAMVTPSIHAIGIVSQELVSGGGLALVPPIVLAPQGIPSGEGFASPALTGPGAFAPVGIGSAEAFARTPITQPTPGVQPPVCLHLDEQPFTVLRGGDAAALVLVITEGVFVRLVVNDREC